MRRSLALASWVLLQVGCTRLSRVETGYLPYAPYVDTLSGVRLRPCEWARADVVAGTRVEFPSGDVAPVAKFGLSLRGRKLSGFGTVDYLGPVPGEFAGMAGMEMEW